MKISAADQQGDAGLWAVASKFTDELRWIFRPQPHRDLGIDGIVEVVEEGVSHGELLALQVKSGDSWFREETSEGVIFRFDEEHYNYWTQYPIPVLVVLHSPTENAAYWEIVNENTARNTGKGWKLAIQRANIVSIQNRDKIRQYCDFELQDNCYSVTSFKDLSHATAKRYEARVLLNKKLSRGEIVQVIARATGEFREREYYRSDLTQDAWRGKKANVVWLFVFPSLEDEKNTNWLCRSQWIDPSLDDRFRPTKMTGISIGEDLVIDWSENYQSMARWRSSVTFSKEEHLRHVENILPSIKVKANEAIQLTKAYHERGIDATGYVKRMKVLQGEIDALYFQGTEIGGAPLECKDFSEKFQSLIAFADNIVLPFSETGLKTWAVNNRDFLVQDAIKHYGESLAEMGYEYRKLH
jgi:hypothetical protein